MTHDIQPAAVRQTWSGAWGTDVREAYVIPLDCGGCVVQVSRWTQNGTTDTVDVSLVGSHWNALVWSSWRWRFKALWYILRGRWDGIDIALLRPAELRALTEVLSKLATEWETEEQTKENSPK